MGFFWLVRGLSVSVAATALGCAARSAAPAPVPSTPTSAPEPVASTTAAPSNPRAPRAAGEMCGGIAGFQCDAKLYCAFPDSAHCGAGDMAGTCQPKPEICSDLYAAVCGCDGKTYPNTCYAQRQGVSVSATGACKP